MRGGCCGGGATGVLRECYGRAGLAVTGRRLARRAWHGSGLLRAGGPVHFGTDMHSLSTRGTATVRTRLGRRGRAGLLRAGRLALRSRSHAWRTPPAVAAVGTDGTRALRPLREAIRRPLAAGEPRLTFQTVPTVPAPESAGKIGLAVGRHTNCTCNTSRRPRAKNSTSSGSR